MCIHVSRDTSPSDSSLVYFEIFLGYEESKKRGDWIKFDVALITLNQHFDISKPQVNPICLPNSLHFNEFHRVVKAIG